MIEKSSRQEEGSIEELIKILNKEISGQLLAEYISKKEKEILQKNIKATNSKLKPRISYIELTILAELYNIDRNKEHVENFETKILEKYPSFGIVFDYLMSRLLNLKLVQKVNNPGYKITKDGKRIIETAIKVYEPFEKALIEDSFLGWLYRELEENES